MRGPPIRFETLEKFCEKKRCYGDMPIFFSYIVRIMKVTLESVRKSTHPSKKWTAVLRVQGHKKRVHFGAKGMSDYTLHGDRKRRASYRRRHATDLDTGDPTRAGYLSYFLLWGKPTLEASVQDYRRRLRVYARTGEFPLNG